MSRLARRLLWPATRRRRQSTPDLLLEPHQLPIHNIRRYEPREHLIDVVSDIEIEVPEGEQELAGRNRGRENRLVSVPPPSEPDVRFSRIRLSGRWSYLHED